MKIHYECPYGNDSFSDRLIFDWDIETGEITGPSAGYFKGWKEGDEIDVMPHGWFHTLGKQPFKSKTDMAAMIGLLYKIPKDLEPYYPHGDWEQAEEDEKNGMLH